MYSNVAGICRKVTFNARIGWRIRMEIDEQTKRKKMALKLIIKTLIYSFAIFGILFILILIGVVGLVSPKMRIAGVPDKAILEIDFNNAYAELRSDDFFAEWTGASSYSVFDLVRAINIASDDNRIKALKANINSSSLGMAQIQDIVNAIKVFKAKGKKTYMYSSSIGSFGGGSKDYYLASVFDEIWIQPSGEIGVVGVNIEVPFFKNVLQKIGVEPEFYSRYEYKTAVSSLISSDFTKEYRQELNKIGGGLYNQLVDGVSKNRNLSVEDVKKAINEAPLWSSKAVEVGFADKTGYLQDLNSYLNTEYRAEFVNIDDYMSAINDYDDKKIPLIAFMVLDGVIEDGISSNSPLNEAVIGSRSVLLQIEELKQKKNLKALVLRINSPGGSYNASDEIRYALENLKKEKNIPIVVSMSDYAASGGYFIALAADYIVAEPATITGSIGVVGGKIVLEQLWKKLGVKWGEIGFGENSSMLSINHKFSTKEKKLFNESLDRVYKDFTQKVMQTRKFDEKKIDEVARGRVWLGKDAFEIGLVDALGSVDVALFQAKNLANIKQGDKFSLMYYPRKQSFQEKLTKYIENGGGLPAVKLMQKYDTISEDINMLLRLRFDAIALPFKVSM